MARVDQQALELVLEHVPDRLPVDAGRLHRDLGHAMLGQPVAQPEQAAHRGLKLRDFLHAFAVWPRRAHARGHLRLVDVQRRRALDDRLHLASTDRSPPAAQEASTTTNLTVVLAAQSGVPGRPRTPDLLRAHTHQGEDGVTGDAPEHPLFPRARAGPRSGHIDLQQECPGGVGAPRGRHRRSSLLCSGTRIEAAADYARRPEGLTEGARR
jgi:hypothetical protein